MINTTTATTHDDGPRTVESLKREAKAIARATTVTHSQALDVLSVQAGYTHWGAYMTSIEEAARTASTMNQAAHAVPGGPSGTTSPSSISDLVRMLVLQDVPSIMAARHLVVTGGSSTGKDALIERLVSGLPEEVLVVDGSGRVRNGPASSKGEFDRCGRRMLVENAAFVVHREIDVHNTTDLVISMNRKSGPSIITTIHASDPDQARSILKDRIAHSGSFHSSTDVDRMVTDCMIACIQMNRGHRGERCITSVGML